MGQQCVVFRPCPAAPSPCWWPESGWWRRRWPLRCCRFRTSILSPGPTLNTLGRASSGPLISISGHPTYPTSGHLNLVTVSFLGGPGDGFNVFTALRAWLTPHEAVVPEQELFPTGQSEQQVERQDTLQMVSSQQTAEAAALCALNIHYTHAGHRHPDREGTARGRGAGAR